MPIGFIRPTFIYRISHYRNLEFTLANGLFCRNSDKCDPNYFNIGHKNLIDKRGNRNVPIDPGGVLNDYVPFYFAPRSPMLYSINKGNVQGFQGTQNDIIYLVSSVQEIKASKIPYVFTDGHAYVEISQFYNTENDLRFVDWVIMGATYWNNTVNDNDRSRRRMAEFLVYQFVPITCIFGIVVIDDIMETTVNEIQRKCNTNIKTYVKPKWYY
ncbi:MAG: DUF4433 domain-containing protein [Ignavibacteriaceae bacterium]|nr:DUF4433 domain-containing protein [Ignavibacteriaceae bacterium]